MLWRLKPSLYGTTLRRRLALLAGGSLGGALAALVIAGGAWPPSSRATPLQLPRLSLRDNKQHLSSAEMTTLLQRARRYRACAVRHGASLDAPTRGENEVLISGRGGSRISGSQFRRRFPCLREMVEPPAFSALALTADRRFHLYLPRTCRLPLVRPAPG
jgi:hypothetical protein